MIRLILTKMSLSLSLVSLNLQSVSVLLGQRKNLASPCVLLVGFRFCLSLC